MKITRIFISTRLKVCLAFAVLALSACSENTSTIDVAADGNSLLKMAPPAFLNTRAVVPENLRLQVTINRERVEMVQSGDLWEGQTTVPVGSDVALEVLWSELFGSRELPLAIAQESVNSINNNYSFQVIDTSYVIDGAGFDADDDSVNNLTERKNETNPYDRNSPGIIGERDPLVELIGTKKPNDIDAVYNEAFWSNAVFTELSGGDSLINNLIVDETGMAVDGLPNYQWGGTHDGEYLTLFVFGKVNNPPEGVSVTRDSGDFPFQDDSLEIYLDGNFSRASDYDTVDDLQIIIPLVDFATGGPNNSSNADSEIYTGNNVYEFLDFDVKDAANVEYATCLCQGQRVAWEVRINMAAANIRVDETFGFELQINRDDNGGARDSKWAWFAPSQQPGEINQNTDQTWRFPSLMGRIRLKSIPGG